MYRKMHVVALTLLLIAAFAQTVFAAQRGPATERGLKAGPVMAPLGGAPLLRAMEQLGLTPEQRQAVKTILQSHRQEAQEVQKSLLDARKAVDDAVAVGDEAKIREAANAFGAAVANAAVLRAKVWKEIQAILTPEQQAKAEELRSALRQSIEEGRKERFEQRRKQVGQTAQ